MLRTPFNYDTDVVSFETGFSSEKPSRTKQSERDDSDINNIVRRFGLTGQLPTSVRQPTYGDFIGPDDYQQALHIIMDADSLFMDLPSEIRKRFNNDPAEYLAFIEDPANIDEAIELGLVNRPPVDGAGAPQPEAGNGLPASADGGSSPAAMPAG